MSARRVENRIVVDGAMALPTARGLFAEGNALIADGLEVLDFAAVTNVDSSGLAVVFGWLRTAKAGGRTLSIINPPQDFISLAEVYDVADQLPLV